MSFGPTFGYELAAAGLNGGLNFSWSSDGTISGRENLTPSQQALLDNVIAAHNPSAKKKNAVRFETFISRWTDAEYALLMQRRASAISAGNVTLVKQWDMAVTVGSVDLNLPAAVNFKTAIVSAGILTQARADIIFS